MKLAEIYYNGNAEYGTFCQFYFNLGVEANPELAQ
jgi:hypothetical protein